MFFLLLIFWSCEKESEPDTIPPTVLIISPDDGLTVSDSVTITCISTDNEGVEKVELYVNNVPIDITYERESYTLSWNISSTDSNSYTIIRSQPYALYWDTGRYDDGLYTITVRSYDVNENIADSEPITLNIRKFVELWGASYSVGNTTTLSLQDNQLSGSIPPEIGNLTGLDVLYLSDNHLNGEIPWSICNLVDINCLIFLNNNLLCPPYPSCIEDNVQYQDTSDCP